MEWYNVLLTAAIVTIIILVIFIIFWLCRCSKRTRVRTRSSSLSTPHEGTDLLGSTHIENNQGGFLIADQNETYYSDSYNDQPKQFEDSTKVQNHESNLSPNNEISIPTNTFEVYNENAGKNKINVQNGNMRNSKTAGSLSVTANIVPSNVEFDGAKLQEKKENQNFRLTDNEAGGNEKGLAISPNTDSPQHYLFDEQIRNKQNTNSQSEVTSNNSNKDRSKTDSIVNKKEGSQVLKTEELENNISRASTTDIISEPNSTNLKSEETLNPMLIEKTTSTEKEEFSTERSNPQVQEMLKQLEEIYKDAGRWGDEILKFDGKRRTFLHIQEMLLRCIDSVDLVYADGKDIIRQNKRRVIAYVQSQLDMLEVKRKDISDRD